MLAKRRRRRRWPRRRQRVDDDVDDDDDDDDTIDGNIDLSRHLYHLTDDAFTHGDSDNSGPSVSYLLTQFTTFDNLCIIVTRAEVALIFNSNRPYHFYEIAFLKMVLKLKLPCSMT